MKRSSCGTDTGVVRAALWEVRGSNEVGVDQNINVDDPERRKIGTAGVIGTRKIEYRRSAVGFQGDGGKDRVAE